MDDKPKGKILKNARISARIWASVIDAFILSLFSVPFVLAALSVVSKDPTFTTEQIPHLYSTFIAIAMTLLSVPYIMLCNWRVSETIGRRLLNIEIRPRNTGLKTRLLRDTAFKWAPTMIGLSLPYIGLFIVIAFWLLPMLRGGLSVADRLTDTRVMDQR